MTKHPILSLDNTEIPAELTSQLVQKIMMLRPSIKTDYLHQNFLSKYVSPDTAPANERRAQALFKWLLIEQGNEATNDRLLLTHGEYNILPRVTYRNFVEFCCDLIRDIIGDSPPIEALIGTFSGGASTSRPRTKSHPASKYLGKAHVTPSCLDIFSGFTDEMPGWIGLADLAIKPVRGNVFFTVPKNATIDRCACKEPDINMFVQKGIGSFFRKGLRSHGIDLNDQSINRRLAREGSVTQNLVTLDLSSASDTVTTELVFQLLPITWYTLLDSVRCQVTVIDGVEHRNHMFSSMGNGFTFELETLVFYAISRAVAFFTGTRGKISVYGDDIICPSGMSDALITALTYFGFSVNMEKSCLSGQYRESCGGHYFNGLDITPFYIRSPIATLPDLIHVANQLREWAFVEGLTILDPEVEPIWLWLKSHIPNGLWGGGDTTFKYQLASYDVPELRLYEEKKSSSTYDGGFFHWLNATWDRTTSSYRTTFEDGSIHVIDRDGVSTSKKSIGKGRFRLRPVRTTAVPRLPALFYSELR